MQALRALCSKNKVDPRHFPSVVICAHCCGYKTGGRKYKTSIACGVLKISDISEPRA